MKNDLPVRQHSGVFLVVHHLLDARTVLSLASAQPLHNELVLTVSPSVKHYQTLLANTDMVRAHRHNRWFDLEVDCVEDTTSIGAI